MNKIKFEKKICKVLTNAEPYYKEVELKVFTYKNTEFGFNFAKNDLMEFTHLPSGSGFNGNGATKLKDVLASIMFREKTVGVRKFWKIVKNLPSLTEKISQVKEEKILNNKKLRILKLLTRLTGFTFQQDRFSLIFGTVSWDICKTDDELKRYFGDEYPDDISMSQFIEKTFGKRVLSLTNTLLK